MSAPGVRPVRGVVLTLITLLAAACASPSPTPPGSASAGSPATTAPSPRESTPPEMGSQSPAATATPSTRASFDPMAVHLGVDVIVGGLAAPVDVAVPGDRGDRLFVVEQAGRIRIVDNGTLAGEPFLDITERVASGGERGLLGLAFHPSFPDDPRLFVDYTDRDGDTVIAEYRLTPGGAVADPTSERILLRIDQPYGNHNGGAVVFGPDGLLYIAMGDGGSGGDPHGNGQRLDTLLGKILRIDVDGAGRGDRPYVIPTDNPFVEVADALPEIWLTGLRNPWRMRFDSATGALWIGDVGQGAWEEIDVAPAGQGGLDFGWNVMEGSHCFQPSEGCDQDGLTLPVAEYGHGFGCAVIGGVVVRDPGQPLLDGGYLFSDACSGNLWLLDADRAGERAPVLVRESGRSISSIALAGDGTVVATDLSSGELVAISGTPR